MTPCILWTGTISGWGYPVLPGLPQERYAHRAAYIEAHGPIPPGHEVDHLCRVRACVNPDHLEAVTHAENVRRGNLGQQRPLKTHCVKGHPFDGTNTVMRSNGRYRSCLTCNRDKNRRYAARVRAAARQEAAA